VRPHAIGQCDRGPSTAAVGHGLALKQGRPGRLTGGVLAIVQGGDLKFDSNSNSKGFKQISNRFKL
jgi:hypothetical protein